MISVGDYVIIKDFVYRISGIRRIGIVTEKLLYEEAQKRKLSPPPSKGKYVYRLSNKNKVDIGYFVEEEVEKYEG